MTCVATHSWMEGAWLFLTEAEPCQGLPESSICGSSCSSVLQKKLQEALRFSSQRRVGFCYGSSQGIQEPILLLSMG